MKNTTLFSCIFAGLFLCTSCAVTNSADNPNSTTKVSFAAPGEISKDGWSQVAYSLPLKIDSNTVISINLSGKYTRFGMIANEQSKALTYDQLNEHVYLYPDSDNSTGSLLLGNKTDIKKLGNYTIGDLLKIKLVDEHWVYELNGEHVYSQKTKCTQNCTATLFYSTLGSNEIPEFKVSNGR